MTAWTLARLGFAVSAFHMRLHGDDSSVRAALEAARLLEIDLEIVDFRDRFEQLIIEPFVRAYLSGLTPSPCVDCNPAIKFGLLRDCARSRGIRFLATGHYARIRKLSARAGFQAGWGLVRPRDRIKDQTYFLSRLDADILEHTVFPLCAWSKPEVKALAASLGFPDKPESQEICFMAGGNYRDFILAREGEDASRPGDIVDETGRALGRHKGLIHYTVGQRRGIDLPGPEPYYVLSLESARNLLVIGPKKRTMTRQFRAERVVFSRRPEEDEFSVLAQIRSRHAPAPARVRLLTESRAEVEFEAPQPSIAAGQAAAFYLGDELVGGGWIEKTSQEIENPIENPHSP